MTTVPDRIPMVIPADNLPGPEQGHWTSRDYMALPNDGIRYEVVDGVLFKSPSPNRWHQETVGELFSYLRNYLKYTGRGIAYLAPFDVELAPNVIVQPDVMVLLNASRDKIKENRIVGAPDLVVEVTSPGTVGFDRREKQNAYARAGVQEYWIVDPIARTVEVLTLVNNRYRPVGIFRGRAILPSKVVPELDVHVEQFFVQ
ncbi:MAG: Uma2 family endonuclease [Chloroflexi bacterium]|nr:MAG: Uma2 family endonuclease [Chloroflexota bacterium]